LGDGPLVAVADATGYAPKLVRDHATPGGPAVRIALGRGAVLEVLAPRLSGKPAAGYLCELDRASLMPLPAARARCDAEGVARFEGLPPGRYILTISKDGLWHASVDVKEEEDENGETTVTRSLTLGRSPTAPIATRNVTVGEEGDVRLDLSDVAGATITGTIVADPPLERPWSVRLAGSAGGRDTFDLTECDADGRFRFEHVAPGTYRVAAFAPEGGGGETSVEAKVSAGAEDVSVVLHLAPGEIAGLVRGPDGAPLPDAFVFILPRDRQPELAHTQDRGVYDHLGVIAAHVRTDADGGFTLRDVPAGAYFCYASRRGRLARVPVELERNGRAHVEARLDDAHLHRMDLRFVDEAGEPVDVGLVVRGEHAGLLISMALDDTALASPMPERDRYVYHVAPGRYFVDAYVPGYAPVRGRAIDMQGDRETIVRMIRGVPVAFTLRSPGGALAGEAVTLRAEDGSAISASPSALQVLLQPQPWETDADGRVRFPALAPGGYTLERTGRRIAAFRVGNAPIEREVVVRDE
jgi:protocatechuate 3,4-dioxygenase beta subunit